MADEFDLKPTSRGEEFLDVILRSLGGDTPDIPQPAWRYEEYLAAIANAIQNGGGGGGSGGGVLVVHDVDGTLDKTWQEIYAAIENGGIPIVTGTPTSTQAYITILGALSGGMPPTMKYNVYNIGANVMMDEPLYVADTASDYPAAYTG